MRKLSGCFQVVNFSTRTTFIVSKASCSAGDCDLKHLGYTFTTNLNHKSRASLLGQASYFSWFNHKPFGAFLVEVGESSNRFAQLQFFILVYSYLCSWDFSYNLLFFVLVRAAESRQKRLDLTLATAHRELSHKCTSGLPQQMCEMPPWSGFCFYVKLRIKQRGEHV